MQNVQNAITHLKNHQKYPASYSELLAECQGLSDFSAGDKEWIKSHLAKKTYMSADEVVKELGLKVN